MRSSLEATQQEIIEKLRADFEDQMQKQKLAFEQEKEIQSATISSLEGKYNEILAKITTSEELLQQKDEETSRLQGELHVAQQEKEDLLTDLESFKVKLQEMKIPVKRNTMSLNNTKSNLS